MHPIINFLLGGSTIILFSIAIYTLLHRRVPGASSLFIQMVAGFIWTLASYLEINSTGLESKIIWRNLQQIGVFLVPISCMFFAIDYSKQKNLRKYAYGIGIIPIMTLALIFTDKFHHLMRTGYEITNKGPLKEVLVVHSSTFGMIMVSINYFIQLIAVIILVDFMKKVPKYFKNQVLLIILSMFLTPFLDWMKPALIDGSDIYLPVSLLYVPSAIILFHCLLKYNVLRLTPIARDKIFDVVNVGILILDKSGNIVDRNPYAMTIIRKYIDISKDTFGMSIYDVFKNKTEIDKLIVDDQETSVEVEVRKEYGSSYLLCTKHPIGTGQDNIIGQVIMINDITEKKIYELGLKAKAEKDSLTGLLNRNGFNDTFGKILQEARVVPQSITVFMIDIDLFKKVNDTYGHINGDKVLQHFAGILKDTLRSGDAIGRIGGEEFAVVLPGIDKNDAFIIAERIRKRVEESSITILDDEIINYTVSIGIADNSSLNVSQERLLHMADVALYKAKETTRNCTIIYNQ